METIILMIVAYAFLKTKNENAQYETSTETVVISPNAGTVVTDPKTGNTVIHASISKAKAKAISAGLVAEMSKLFASELVIMNLLKGLNDADYKLIYKEFGYQHFDNVTNSIGGVIFYYEQDLTDALTREVASASNKSKLKSWFPTIF